MEGNDFSKYKRILEQTRGEKENVIEFLSEIFPHKEWKSNDILIHQKTLKIRLSSSEKTIFILRQGVALCKEKGYVVSLV